jgi:Alginate lyase
LPNNQKYKEFNQKDYITEALRITKVFFLNNDTMMNPNMNYAEVGPSSGSYPKSLSDLYIDPASFG